MKSLSIEWPDNIFLLTLCEHEQYKWRALVRTEFEWRGSRIPMYGGDYGDTPQAAVDAAIKNLESVGRDMANKTGIFGPSGRPAGVQQAPVDPANPLSIRI
jgi:hypothetical protein